VRLELQHVSIAIPPGRRNEARAFYGELLGLDERVVPPKLNPEELIWFRAGGDLELHLFDSNEPALRTQLSQTSIAGPPQVALGFGDLTAEAIARGIADVADLLAS
jgi:hypothetical protein